MLLHEDAELSSFLQMKKDLHDVQFRCEGFAETKT
jgi:hypothetical protein